MSNLVLSNGNTTDLIYTTLLQSIMLYREETQTTTDKHHKKLLLIKTDFIEEDLHKNLDDKK